MEYTIKTIKKACIQCANEFDAIKKEHNRGNAKFCSIKCASKHRISHIKKPEPNCNCSTCGEEFYRSKSKQTLAKHGYQFCSRKCKDLAQRMNSPFSIEAIFPDHYDIGKYVNYRNRAFEHRPMICERCQYDKVPEVLQVHHKDRNRLNSDVSNLEILCPNCHFEDHFNHNDGLFWNNGGVVEDRTL